MLKCPKPKDVSQVRYFLGLINYYHNFLPNLSSLLNPIHELLNKGKKWNWRCKCDDAFNEEKMLLASDVVLTHYDPKLPLRLACDASAYGLGAVLSHTMSDGTERPIAYVSRTLSKAEINYSQIDKEALAIIWGVKKFHNYLYGQNFIIVTDHQPLTSIFHPKKSIPIMTAARLQRYAIILSAHNYSIEYKRNYN